MSTSDSDCPANQLAGGHQDKGSLFGLDCKQAVPGRTTPLPEESASGDVTRGRRWPSRCGHTNCGSPSSSTEFPDREGDAVPPSAQRQCAGSPFSPGPQDALGERPHLARKRLESSELSAEPDWTADRNELFAHKCLELQCYIPPLSSILNGLRSGRYRERLSSFQESVAMDRIQRILGVLQNRCVGERYIHILLKVEEMLKNWFPTVKPREQHAAGWEGTTPSKKQKLCPGAAAQPVPLVCRSPIGEFLPHGEARLSTTYSTTRTKWLHTSPICSPTVELTPERLPSADKDVTQDNAVSSSTDIQTDAPPRRLPPGRINAPCLERLLKSTESIVTCRSTGGASKSSWSW